MACWCFLRSRACGVLTDSTADKTQVKPDTSFDLEPELQCSKISPSLEGTRIRRLGGPAGRLAVCLAGSQPRLARPARQTAERSAL